MPFNPQLTYIEQQIGDLKSRLGKVERLPQRETRVETRVETDTSNIERRVMDAVKGTKGLISVNNLAGLEEFVSRIAALYGGSGGGSGSSPFTWDGSNASITGGIISTDVITSDSLRILEGTAPSNEAGYGKVYVKSSDSKLYFKDDGGTEYDLTATGSGTGITWSEVTGTSQAGVVNAGYVTNNVARVTVTLPTTAAIGDIVEVVGRGAGGWRVAQNAGEYITTGNLTSTTGVGGYVESTEQYDTVRLICIETNTGWRAQTDGNITVA